MACVVSDGLVAQHTRGAAQHTHLPPRARVQAGCNPMYTYREAVPLGPTPLSLREIRAIMQQLKADWPGG
jgi:hypothetical protein